MTCKCQNYFVTLHRNFIYAAYVPRKMNRSDYSPSDIRIGRVQYSAACCYSTYAREHERCDGKWNSYDSRHVI